MNLLRRLFRRSIDWEAQDWAAFFLAGGLLTVDAWERATPRSRGLAIAAARAVQGGPRAPEPAPDDALARLGERAACLDVGRQMAEASARGESLA